MCLHGACMFMTGRSDGPPMQLPVTHCHMTSQQLMRPNVGYARCVDNLLTTVQWCS